ncbi:MAG: zinc ABC transporter substrate-binding protein [Clostridia bacterium]|nr:zinc ABC transporter substrate-binding protein [Clostridia bacterium]
MIDIKFLNAFLLFCLTMILILTFTACNGVDVSRGNNKRIIAVSIVPQAAFVEKVCGDELEVVTMIPSGASPETYEPTPAQLQKLESAELYFSIGVPSENNILSAVKSGTEVIDLHTKLADIYSELEIDGGRDPHIWLSPKRVIAMVREICNSVSKLYPQKADAFLLNAEEYILELQNLDTEIKAMFEQSGTTDFLVFHPAFGYFADEYGLTMHALEEHGKEASAKQLAKTVELAKEKDIKVIFYQAEASVKQAEAFAEEINGKAVLLEPLAYNYIENLRKMAVAVSGESMQ